MDIKPANILISKGPRVFYRYDGDEYGDDDDSNEETTYKIGKLILDFLCFLDIVILPNDIFILSRTITFFRIFQC